MGCIKSKVKIRKSLPDADMQYLKRVTRYDEKHIQDLYDNFRQDCPNERFTQEQFIDMYQSFFPSGNVKEFCEQVFRTFDTDKDGFINFKEFLFGMHVTSAETPEEKLRWAFRMYDVDGNGFIDPDEMLKVLRAIYGMLHEDAEDPTSADEERAMEIFCRIDENGDGQITGEEFLRGCLEDDELSKLLAPNIVEHCE